MEKLKNFLKIFWQKLIKIPNTIGLLLIWFYRITISPSVGILRYLPGYPRPSCIFYPTCSEYGVICYKKYGFIKATSKTISRIRRCHPSSVPGIDMP